MKRFLLFATVLFLSQAMPAQSPCYDKIREDGLRYMRQKNYGEAINQFWTALFTCPDKPAVNDLEKLIRNCQRSWVGDLEDAVMQAVSAKELAEKAKKSEAVARQEAESNAVKAQEQGKKAESLRLALLADIVREQGKKSDALLLSFLALQLAGPAPSAALSRAFGEAVKDSLSRLIFDAPTPVVQMVYLPQNQKIALRLSDQSVYVADLKTAEKTRIAPPAESPRGMVASADGARLGLWTDDGPAQVFSINGILLATLKGHTEAIRYVAFSPDGAKIVTGARDNTARLWNADGNPVATLSGHTGNVYSAFFTANGPLITRSSDGTAGIWDAQGKRIASIGGGLYVHDVQTNPAGDRIVTASADGVGRLYDAGGQLLAELNPRSGPAKAAFFTPLGDRIVLRTQGGISIYDARGALLKTLPPDMGTQACANASGSYMLTWADSPVARLWDQQGRLVREMTGHRRGLTGASFAPEAPLLLTASVDGTTKLQDFEGDILVEWLTGGETGLPGFFASDGLAVVVPHNNNRNISLAPLPGPVFEQLREAATWRANAVTQLMEKYNIQFVEALAH